jgi:hypothetical protein
VLTAVGDDDKDHVRSAWGVRLASGEYMTIKMVECPLCQFAVSAKLDSASWTDMENEADKCLLEMYTTVERCNR